MSLPRSTYPVDNDPDASNFLWQLGFDQICHCRRYRLRSRVLAGSPDQLELRYLTGSDAFA